MPSDTNKNGRVTVTGIIRINRALNTVMVLLGETLRVKFAFVLLLVPLEGMVPCESEVA